MKSISFGFCVSRWSLLNQKTPNYTLTQRPPPPRKFINGRDTHCRQRRLVWRGVKKILCRKLFKFSVIYDVVFMTDEWEEREIETRERSYRMIIRGTMQNTKKRHVFEISSDPTHRVLYSLLTSADRPDLLYGRGTQPDPRKLWADRRALYPVIYWCKSISRKAMLLAIARWRMIRQTAFSAGIIPSPPHSLPVPVRVMRTTRLPGPSFPFIDTQHLSLTHSLTPFPASLSFPLYVLPPDLLHSML